MFASSVIVPHFECFSQVTEYQIEQFCPKLRVLDSQSSSLEYKTQVWVGINLPYFIRCLAIVMEVFFSKFTSITKVLLWICKAIRELLHMHGKWPYFSYILNLHETSMTRLLSDLNKLWLENKGLYSYLIKHLPSILSDWEKTVQSDNLLLC